jgi:hypothetical protein
METASLTENKQLLLDRLRESERVLVDAASVPEEFARICPQPGYWSVLDVVEHTTLADRGMLKRYENASVNTKPANPDGDALVEKIGRDRNRKRNAPGHVHPAGRFASLAEALNEYRKSRALIVGFVENSNENLRRKLVQHPLMEMDGYQLFLLIAAHSERHAKQIEAVKGSKAYQDALRQEVQS